MSAQPEEKQKFNAKTLREAVRDLQFIGKQIARFEKLSFKQLTSHMRSCKADMWCELERPGKGNPIVCGAAAWARFTHLVDLICSECPELARRVGRPALHKAVKKGYVSLVIDFGKPINNSIAKELLEFACGEAEKSMRDSEHSIPCDLFAAGSVERFQVGPVEFLRRPLFFRQRKIALKSGIEMSVREGLIKRDEWVAKGFSPDQMKSEGEFRAHGRAMYAQAIKIYRGYRWVACVKIHHHVDDVAEQLALRVVNLAIHVLRVVIGAGVASGLGLAWSPTRPHRDANLWFDSSGCMRVKISTRVKGVVALMDWDEVLGPPFLPYLTSFGSSLFALAEGRDVSHIQQRLIDSLTWFGDAATDLESAAKIVKYVSAIERVIIAGRQEGTRVTFMKRLQALYEGFQCDGSSNIGDRASRLYVARSAILHGEMSHRDGSLKGMVEEAEDIARLCLHCISYLYPMLLCCYGDISSELLEKLLSKVQVDGVEWLVSEHEKKLLEIC
ncbi:HEPN domain-containing protein [Xanthomonas vasicola]|uniref:HEPN domain-containing protein n=1 Tax=Xanthomonas vasicola TaxID=56459 RepID=UPI0016006457|nr:HEPN domain-containing protein [Xanthomonas vasicola]